MKQLLLHPDPEDLMATATKPETRRKTADHEAGTAQETTTIEANARLTADGRCKIATKRLALCSFDQHGSASLSSDIG